MGDSMRSPSKEFKWVAIGALMLMMCASSMYTKEIGNMNMDEYDGDNKYMIMATIGDNPMYSDQIPQAIVYDEKSLKSANKRSSSTYRLCGSRLIDAIKSVCGNCIKPIGFRPVEVKRDGSYLALKRNQLVERCCLNRCSLDEMKIFCC